MGNNIELDKVGVVCIEGIQGKVYCGYIFKQVKEDYNLAIWSQEII